jgi:hypothetical protein
VRSLAGKNQQFHRSHNHTNPPETMGDKSPKAKQKESSQKQAKANSATQAKSQAKSQALAGRQAPPKK